jgi:hypothetical protein
MPSNARQAVTPLNIQQLLAAKQMGLGDYIAQAEMKSRTPTLRERIGNLIYDAAQGAGLRQSAQSMRSNAETAVDFVPGLGDAIGAQEAGRDLGAGNYLSGGLGLAATLVPGAIAEKAVKKGIRAYHATDKAFDKFDPGWRGAAFFASTPERAKTGATAGAQDLHHLYAPTPGEGRGPLNVMEVMLPADKIDGLHYTPSEVEWFNALPDRATSDNIDDVLKDMPSPIDPYLWQTIYDERQLPDGTFEYIKKSLPQISYEDAYTKGRDVYGRQFAHYSDQTGEGKVAERVRNRGMGGYLVNDEAGLSIGVIDPSLIEVLGRQ